MFSKSILIKIRNIILPLLMIHVPVVAEASNWNSGGSSFQVEAQTLNCEFQKYENSGYKISVAKSWIRENQTHIFNGMGVTYPDRSDWGTARITTNNSNKLAWEYRILTKDNKGSQSESRFKYVFFKTNNKVAASVNFVGYLGISNVWGTCKVDASAAAAPSPTTNDCSSDNLTVCDNDFICQKATSVRSGSREWEITRTWEPYVKEAKSRGLKCDVNLSTSSSNSTSSSSKIDKAKATCTDLGFTAGTEKHGECVLKVMDN